ncbi:MAG: fumarylacetoacetate hydrolase family protein [Chitinophagaceae bacterium]
MHLYKTTEGNVLKYNGKSFLLTDNWDTLINQQNLYSHLMHSILSAQSIPDEQSNSLIAEHLLPPIGSQEVWAAGVTYLRSRDARMEESKESGSADCYSKVYEAERPELFFKSLPHRVKGHGGKVRIRKDSKWDVPEPELTLFINSSGDIQAYTIGNDMSSRSIEGENPLYLPQAKMYEGSAAVGPCLYIPEKAIPVDTGIHMKIYREDKVMYEGHTTLTQMKRTLKELAGYLFLEFDFQHGCFLMTGTCLVPPNSFTLQEGDVVEISIDGIGSMKNIVTIKKK